MQIENFNAQIVITCSLQDSVPLNIETITQLEEQLSRPSAEVIEEVAKIDGERDLAAVHAALREANPDLAWERFYAEFMQLFGVLNGLGKMFLRFPAG